MSGKDTTQGDLEQRLGDLGRDLRPPAGWEDRVFARLDEMSAETRPRPTGWMLATAAMALVAVVSGAGAYLFWKDNQRLATRAEETAAAAAEHERRVEAQIEMELEAIRAMDENTARMLADLRQAEDEAARAQLIAEIAKVKSRKESSIERLRALKNVRSKAKDAKSTGSGAVAKCKDPNDPLCGL